MIRAPLLDESGRHGNVELLLDGSGQCGRTLADPELHRLFERKHDPEFGETFGENTI
jgi:hypothetical protein